MNDQQLMLLNMSIQLLQVVQKEINVESLSKDFWIQLGMVYKTYQYEIQKSTDMSGSSEVIVQNETFS